MGMPGNSERIEDLERRVRLLEEALPAGRAEGDDGKSPAEVLVQDSNPEPRIPSAE